MMTHRLPTISIAASLLLGSLGAGCAEPVRGDKPEPEVPDASDTSMGETTETIDDETDGTEPIPLSFETDGVHTLLIDGCTGGGCHETGAGGYTLNGDLEADYLASYDRVTPGDGEGSKLVKKGAGISSHTGGPILQPDTPEYELLVDWIDDGANP